MFCVSLDDDSTVFYDVYIKEVGKKEREAKKLLDAFGKICGLHGVCDQYLGISPEFRAVSNQVSKLSNFCLL